MKLFWVFVQPAAQLALLMIIFTMIGRAGGYGTSFALFLLSGIATLHLFNSSSSGVMRAIVQLGSPRRLARAGVFDDALAALCFRFVVGLVSAIALAFGVTIWQHLEGVPYDGLACLEGFLAVALFGFGTGLMRGWWQRFMPAAERFYAIFSRPQIFISGIFYVPSFLPPVLRDLLAWNPVLHGVEWVRTGVYANYPELVLSRPFLLGIGLAATAMGMSLIWHHRRRILR